MIWDFAKRFIYLFFLVSIVFFAQCTQGEKQPQAGFYYWKTIYKLSEPEKLQLENLAVNTLYIRYFDVDLDRNNLPFPVGAIRFEQKPAGFKFIPVVYIKNKVMLLKKLDIASLSTNVFDYINQINKSNGIECDEIQIDCDWTLQSRDNYLKFIELLKKESEKRLSATIRLHQVKYYLRTKIPNVDYGVLMYYNMGTIASDSLNSVYNRNAAKKYLHSLKSYPLQLDIALPIFSWGIHIRNGKVIDIISKVNNNTFAIDTNFIAQSNNIYKAKNATFKSGNYYKQNDEVKIEKISFDDLKEMASDLKNNIKEKPEMIIFYDLDSINLINYKNENQNFKEILNYF